MSKTRLTTLTIEEELFREAKAILASRGVSFAGFVRAQLRYLVKDPDGELSIPELQNSEEQLALK